MNDPAFIKVDKATFYRFIAQVPDNERYEFVRGRIVQQQAGGTFRHSRITARIAEVCREQINRSAWEVVVERGVETAETIRFADVVVEPVDADPLSLGATQPALIAEVLSPSSGDRDLNEKPDEYLSLASLQAYIIASQSERACLAWVRGTDGTFPAEPAEVRGDDAVIAGPTLGLAIRLADVYRGIIELPATNP